MDVGRPKRIIVVKNVTSFFGGEECLFVYFKKVKGTRKMGKTKAPEPANTNPLEEGLVVVDDSVNDSLKASLRGSAIFFKGTAKGIGRLLGAPFHFKEAPNKDD